MRRKHDSARLILINECLRQEKNINGKEIQKEEREGRKRWGYRELYRKWEIKEQERDRYMGSGTRVMLYTGCKVFHRVVSHID